MSKKRSNRLVFSLISIIIFFAIVMIKLGYVQIFQHKTYAQLADKQRKRDERLLAKRGNIFDRNGLKLAVSVEKETVFATPYLLKNKPQVAKQVAAVLKIPKNLIYEKITQPKGFVFLKRKVSKGVADRIRKLGIEGISLYKEHQRDYPSGRTASQIVGFVGLDNQALTGLELEYEKYLQGHFGRIKDERDAFGHSIPGSKGLFVKPKDGNSLILTIDRDIQYKAQVELKAAVKKWKAVSGNVVVLNPQTGEVLAMASVPDFDLNNFSKASKESIKNQAVVSLYEPGSTLKIIAATGAVEEGLYTADSMFYLPPTINVAGKNIKEAHARPAQNWTLAQIIAESSNVGMSKVGVALGKYRLYKYLQKFGILNKTGIDFPGEISGYAPKPAYWYGPTVATVAFGQGVAVTPLQLARAYSVIANGGKLFRPYLIKKIITPDGKKIKENKPKVISQAISQKSAFEGMLMLEKVISEGTGKGKANIKGYTVAGKTGTAQKANVGAKGYSGKYISSFIGFAPAENAQVLVLVVVDSPTEAIYGSQVAAPAFKNIMEFSLHKLNIEPQ